MITEIASSRSNTEQVSRNCGIPDRRGVYPRNIRAGAASGMTSKQSGFSLIEVLVAFTIMALALGVVFQIFGRGAAAMTLGEEYAQAVAIAESRLTAAALPQSSVERSGTEPDRYDWALRSEPVTADTVSETGLALNRIDVEVHWRSRGREHQIGLTTLKPVALE